jgi:Plasmid encoded RepA protein
VSKVSAIHTLIEQHGRLGAIERLPQPVTEDDRRVLEIAAAFMGDEKAGTASFLYSGWCLTSLPHRRIPDAEAWRLDNGGVTLLVEPGRRILKSGSDVFCGVPYGSTARLILIFLQSEALKNNSRQVELGSSMRRWLARLGKEVGGTTVRAVQDQALRISTCKFSFHGQIGGARAMANQTIVDNAILWEDGDDRQSSLFTEGVTLSEGFYRALREHAVPLEERALRQIADSSLALDVYAWLAYRLHVLEGPIHVTWPALMGQFGRSFKRMDDFKPKFRKALRAALAVYPEAAEKGVEEYERGLRLRRTRPPVLPK